MNQQILENMIREIAQRGRTIIFSTHVMEHAERLCDRIILMSDGAKIFDGTTEEALETAPRRVAIDSDDSRLRDLVDPFAQEIVARDDGSLMLTLNKGANAQKILETCVKQKISLTRFAPRNPTLHEAFVAMVGHSRGFDTAEAAQ